MITRNERPNPPVKLDDKIFYTQPPTLKTIEEWEKEENLRAEFKEPQAATNRDWVEEDDEWENEDDDWDDDDEDDDDEICCISVLEEDRPIVDNMNTHISKFLSQLNAVGKYYDSSEVYFTSEDPFDDYNDGDDRVYIYVKDRTVHNKNRDLQNKYQQELAAYNNWVYTSSLTKDEEKLKKIKAQIAKLEREACELEINKVAK